MTLISRRCAILLGLLAILLLGACTAKKSDNNNGGGGGDNTTASMTSRVNTYRTGAGQPALHSDTTLNQIAQAQAEYNSSHSINSDTDAGGKSLADQVKDAGYNHTTIAYLFDNQSETATFNEWKNNPAYSGILTDPTYSDIGVGTATNGSVRRWVLIVAAKGAPTNGTVTQMLDKINNFRTAGGASTLTLNDNLSVVAQQQAEYNASVQADDTTNAGGKEILEQVTDTGYTYGTLMWTVGHGDPDTVFGLWTDTPTEVTQMRNNTLADVGIGVASGGSKQWWVVVYAQPVTPGP